MTLCLLRRKESGEGFCRGDHISDIVDQAKGNNLSGTVTKCKNGKGRGERGVTFLIRVKLRQKLIIYSITL